MAGKDQNQMSRVKKNKEAPKTTKKSSKKKKGNRGKKIGWALFFTTVIAIFCALAGYLFIMISGEKILEENKDKLTAYGTSKVYDRNGVLMGELSIQKSEPVKIEDIPEQLKNAFIATEDKRFYEHSGIDIWAIGRAAVKDIMARSLVEGGSTITQQLAKNIFLTRDKTFFRKATEMSIALALERNYTKDEILEMYLNRINFGGPYYGIKAASERYFGKSDLNDLELWEMATLAAMPKGPTKYNPLRNPDLSKERRGVVLTLMEEQGYITAEEAEEAKKVDYNYKPPVKEEKYTAFIDYVMQEAEEKWGLTADDLNVGGYHIYTTMDANAQQALEAEFNNPENFEKGKDGQLAQGSMVIMNQHTGAIVALTGGRDYQRGGYNRSIDSRRSPGSVLKPIAVYAPALETGEYSKNSQLSNKKQCFGNGTYCPTNLNGRYSNTISMSDAIQYSTNIPAVWTLDQIGVKAGYEFTEKLGIKMNEKDMNLSLGLGGMTDGTNTFEIARAFTAFANGGELVEPYAIKQIKNSDGKVVHENKGGNKKRVMKSETASQMTDMMLRVTEGGTGRNAQISRSVAGKTGTTQSGIAGVSGVRDAWFAGYTPELTAAIWLGFDDPGKSGMMKQGSAKAASIWANVMEKAVQGYEPKQFPTTKAPEPVEKEPPKVELEAVRNLTGSYDAQNQTVNLNWSPVDGNGIEYRVYRKESSEAEYRRIMDALGTTSADDMSAMEGLTYSYYVTAYDPAQGIESEPSNILQVVTAGVAPPEEPEELPDETNEPVPPEEGTDTETNPEQEPDHNQGTDQGHGQGDPGQGQGNGNGQGNGQGNGNQGQGGDNTGSGEGTTPPTTGGESDVSGDGSSTQETTTPEAGESTPPASNDIQGNE
ncbi:transglycosylase domain-containing protein [Paenibacillus faecalis]|uniref:transglycosylase domain-containing protein n=1 Tax=Paenibacillus faecalis TaxID=2079532 RepID=UPI000D0F6BDC|nr:PBP1A family penicillin-binding protein [Paenibacillus faecalis]